MKTIGRRIKTMLVTIGLFLLGCILPDVNKRIMLITTLHLELVQRGLFQEEALSKLNAAMELATNDEALKLPAMVHQSVWRHTVLDQVIAELPEVNFMNDNLPYEEVRELGVKLTQATPSWLQYGCDENMVSDFIRLFYSQHAMAKMSDPAVHA